MANNVTTTLAIAHRAGNSIAALRRALDAGVDLVEADVRYFRGVPEIRTW
jgi:glycerophosphoryl diester phosphodiesterase